MNDNGKRKTYGKEGAIREPSNGKGRPSLITPYGLERLSKWCEKGAEKYDDRNWEKGMDFSRYTDSMFRHLIAWMKGLNDEDHLSAIAWNALAIIHHQELGEINWNDMPEYESKKKFQNNKNFNIKEIDLITQDCKDALAKINLDIAKQKLKK